MPYLTLINEPMREQAQQSNAFCIQSTYEAGTRFLLLLLFKSGNPMFSLPDILVEKYAWLVKRISLIFV